MAVTCSNGQRFVRDAICVYFAAVSMCIFYFFLRLNLSARHTVKRFNSTQRFDSCTHVSYQNLLSLPISRSSRARAPCLFSASSNSSHLRLGRKQLTCSSLSLSLFLVEEGDDRAVRFASVFFMALGLFYGSARNTRNRQARFVVSLNYLKSNARKMDLSRSLPSEPSIIH